MYNWANDSNQWCRRPPNPWRGANSATAVVVVVSVKGGGDAIPSDWMIERSLQNKMQYARRHGYDLIVANETTQGVQEPFLGRSILFSAALIG